MCRPSPPLLCHQVRRFFALGRRYEGAYRRGIELAKINKFVTLTRYTSHRQVYDRTGIIAKLAEMGIEGDPLELANLCSCNKCLAEAALHQAQDVTDDNRQAKRKDLEKDYYICKQPRCACHGQYLPDSVLSFREGCGGSGGGGRWGRASRGGRGRRSGCPTRGRGGATPPTTTFTPFILGSRNGNVSSVLCQIRARAVLQVEGMAGSQAPPAVFTSADVDKDCSEPCSFCDKRLCDRTCGCCGFKMCKCPDES